MGPILGSDSQNPIFFSDLNRMGDCEELLEIANSTEKGMTIRVADLYIHALFSYPNANDLEDLQEAFDVYKEADLSRLDRHREHELFLMQKFTGCEREVFNDPTVEYPGWRSYLSGTTGTMSQLIMNGYYVYYLYLVMDVGLEANLLADAQLILTHLIESADITQLTESDWANISQIIRLAVTNEGFPLPSRGWWQSVLNYFTAKRAALAGWEFWQTYPERRSWKGFWEWQPSVELLAVQKPVIPLAPGLNDKDHFGVYEYYPFIPTWQDFPSTIWGFSSGGGEEVFASDFQNAYRKFEDLRDFFAPGNNNRGGRARRKNTHRNRNGNRKSKSKKGSTRRI